MYFRFYLFTSPDGVKFMSLKCTKHVTCKPYLLAERLGGTYLHRYAIGLIVMEQFTGVVPGCYVKGLPFANWGKVLLFPHFCLSVLYLVT